MCRFRVILCVNLCFVMVLCFDVLVNHGADEGVEGAVLLSFARVRVYGGLRVGFADLFLEAGFVVCKKSGLLLFLRVLENDLDGCFGIVGKLGGSQFLVKVDEFGGEVVGFAKDVDIAEFLALRRVLLVVAWMADSILWRSMFEKWGLFKLARRTYSSLKPPAFARCGCFASPACLQR